jgi:hypothetical protein
METNISGLKDSIEKGGSRRETPRCSGPMKKIIKTAPNTVFTGKVQSGKLAAYDIDTNFNGTSELVSNNSRLSKNSSKKSNLLINLPQTAMVGGQETPPSDKTRKPRDLRREKDK